VVPILQHRITRLRVSTAEDAGAWGEPDRDFHEKPDFGIVATEKKLPFPVLSDFGNKVARQFGIVFEIGNELKEFSKNVFKNDLALPNADGSYELPVPATFVIDTGGVIRFAHVDVDYMLGRAEPEMVLAAVEAVAHPVAQ